LNDFISMLKENPRIVLFGAIGILLFSVIIGVVIGVVKRHSALKGVRQAVQEERLISEPILPKERLAGVLIPDPVIPDLDIGVSDFMLYFDQQSNMLESMEMIPVKLSDLIKNRARGLDAEIMGFLFMGEELDILTNVDEIAEP